MKNIKDVFKHHLKIPVDDNLIDKLERFINFWMNKGEHIDFVIGMTVGEQEITYSISDENVFFNDILMIDNRLLKKDLHGLNSIDIKNRTISNINNITIVYLIHRIINSNIKDKDKAINNLTKLLIMIRISSLFHRNFGDFLVTKEIALAASEKLRGNTAIKRMGNWNNVILYVSKDNMEKGINFKDLQSGDDDGLLTTIQRLAHKVNGYYNTYTEAIYSIRETGNVIGTSSIMVDFEDGGKISERLTNPNARVDKLINIITNKNEFINMDIFNLLLPYVARVSKNLCIRTLTYMSNHYLENSKIIREFISKDLHMTETFITGSPNKDELMANLDSHILSVVKRWRHGKTKDTELNEVLNLSKNIIKISEGRFGTSRDEVFIIVYIYLRTILTK